MKSRFFSAVLAMLLIAGLHNTVLAQGPKNVLKINPLSLGLLTANIQYERALSANISAQLGVFYTGFRFTSDGERTTYQGFGVTPEVRFYVSKNKHEAPEGLYVAPFLRYQNFDVEVTYQSGQETDNSRFTAMGGGAILGYQFIFGDVFALDLFAGPSVNFVEGTGTVDQEELPGISGGMIGFRGGVSVGIAF